MANSTDKEAGPSPFTRRDFIVAALAVGAGGIAAGHVIGRHLTRLYDEYGEEATEQLARLGLPEEQRKQLEEVEEFRESLGLEGLPQELEAGLLNPHEWSGSPQEFRNSLSTTNFSYGIRTAELMHTLLGPNFPRLVREVKTDPM